MAVAQTAVIPLGPVLLIPIVWVGFARKRTTFSRFHRKWHGTMTRESGVSWDIRLMAPVTTNSAITVATTRSGCNKVKRRPRRAGNCQKASICADHCWQSLRHAEAGVEERLEIELRNWSFEIEFWPIIFRARCLPIFASSMRPLQIID